MREIKFRGRSDVNNVWHYGDLATGKSPAIVEGDIYTRFFYVDPTTVGQFTGLLDADGREIYEGDIVKCGTGRICEVVYFLSPVHAGYDLNPVGGFDCKPPSELSLWSDLTIIGNVHDNPELLEARA